MIAWLVAVTAHAAPLDLHMHGSLRYRWSNWVLAGAVPARAGAETIPLTNVDDLPNIGVVTYEGQPSLYQIVDLSLSARDEWWFKAHVDSDPMFDEIARWAGEFGHKDLRLHLEQGETTFTGIEVGELFSGDGVDPRIVVPSSGRITTRYRAYGVGEQLAPGVVLGLSLITYDAPAVTEVYTGKEPAEAEGSDPPDPSWAVFGPARRELIGIWMQTSFLESAVSGRAMDGFVIASVEGPNMVAALALESDFVMGLLRVSAVQGDRSYEELTGRRVDRRHAYGGGLVSTTRLLGAMAGHGKKGGFGAQIGYELRTHLLFAFAESRTGRAGAVATRTGNNVFPDLLLGPYAGVAGSF